MFRYNAVAIDKSLYPSQGGFMKSMVARSAWRLVVLSLSAWAPIAGPVQAQQVPVPLTEYMGRQIAQTMHFRAPRGWSATAASGRNAAR